MTNPVLQIEDNLVWTRSGLVWALWRIQGLPYGFRPARMKLQARALHTSLIRHMVGESLWLGVCATQNPAVIVERMLADVDTDACPDWVAECAASFDTLEEIGPGERINVLAVPLGSASRGEGLKAVARARLQDLNEYLGVPKQPVDASELAKRTKQAENIRRGIAGDFSARPLTAAQIVWLWEHAMQRGLYLDDDWPEPLGALDGAGEHLPPMKTTGTAFEPARFIESGNGLKSSTPRILEVQRPTSESSFQALQVLTDTPSNGSIFPGCEFIGRIDECGLDVDWGMRLSVKSGADVATANRRALANMQDQFKQRSEEISSSVTQLSATADQLVEYASLLESDSLEVEAAATVVFAVGADTAEAAAEQGAHLRSHMASAGYKLSSHAGHQEALWNMMVPGTPSMGAVSMLSQITTSKNLASAIPFASTDLGDSKGSLIAWNISTGRPGVVLHDVAGATANDASGSIALIGELGSGKSMLMKKILGDIVDRGGLVLSIDRTDMGEWGVWADAITDTTIVDCSDPKYSLDPLRVFGARLGSRVAESFLITLLNLAPNTPEGAQMTKVLSPKYLEEHDISSLGGMLEHLRSGQATIATADDLLDRISMYADSDFGDVLFDPKLPPFTTPERTNELKAVVFRTHTLDLPTRSEIDNAHLFERMRLEKWFGRATYALLAGMARTLCFSDRSRLAVLGVDEVAHMSGSPEGEEQLKIFVSDGRKHNAACVLAGHDAYEDLGSEKLRGLIPTRVLMRHTDESLARNGLGWLGLDPKDQDLVDIVQNQTSPKLGNSVPVERRGEGFFRDSSGRIGRIKVQAPLVPERFAAASTSPTSELVS